MNKSNVSDDSKSRRPNDDNIDILKKVPVVAIGASAGGLEPLEQFFDGVKDQSSNAFVVIQHLSPNFESMMDELLSRHSGMRIERVVDGMVLVPNTIFLNPPRTEMRIVNGCFKLHEINDETHLNLPIDAFFISVASEYGSDAIAIVLSGTGSDGTLGSGEIKKAGGTVIAQDPASAKFESMPSSVIAKGYADAIGLPEEMSEYISKIRSGLSIVNIVSEEEGGDPILRIFKRLRERFGTEFGYYKRATIERRLRRRSDLRGMSLEDYANVLGIESEETEALYADLLIEVTSFFRDREAYDVIRNDVIPDLVKDMSAANPVRIWVPGCASGEEAYSLAILIADHAVKHKLKLNLKILATDIHHRSLDAASKGIYPPSSVKKLSDDQVKRYFDASIDGESFQIKQNLRRMVVFSPHNVLKDPPFTKMDMISCRNVLIYFNDIAQQKTLAFFHFALAKNGILFLGPSETTGKLQNEFSTIDQKWRIFQKKRNVRLMDAVSLLPSNENAGAFFGSSSSADRLQVSDTPGQLTAPARQAHTEALKELLRQYAPTGFLLSRDGNIVHVLGDAGSFIKVDSGAFTTKIAEMVDDDLKLIISTGLERLKTIDSFDFERQIDTETAKDGLHKVIVKLKVLNEPGNVKNYLLLTLERVKKAKTSPKLSRDVRPLVEGEATEIMQSRIADLERDLKSTEESLQSTIEELETSNEELQATNEELMASNEELQSTNEELHSVNEELYTVSAEHQRKIEELTELTDDMDHLLKATDIGIIFLDADMNIRRFTPSATLTFNLIPQDTGRPIAHITSKFPSVDFVDMIRRVIADEKVIEQEVNVGDTHYMLRVLPYKTTLSDAVGAVITSIDISDLKQAQIAEIETAKHYEDIVSDISEYLMRWNADTNEITYCNQRFCEVIGKPEDQIVGTEHTSVIPKPQLPEILDKVKALKANETIEVDIITPTKNNQYQVRSSAIRAIPNEDGRIVSFQVTGRITTQRYKYRKALESLINAGKTEGDDYQATLHRILEIGAEYLDLPQGSIGRIDGDTFHCLTSFGANAISKGDTIPLEATVSSQLDERASSFSEHNLGKSKLSKQPFYKKSNIEAAVVVRIFIGGQKFGTLSYLDSEPVLSAFTAEQIVFIQIMASTIGHLIERGYQLQNATQQRQHFQEIYYKSPVMMCTIDASGKIVDVNDEWLSSLDFGRSDVIGAKLQKFLAPKVKFDMALLKEPDSDYFRKQLFEFQTKHKELLSVELSAIRRNTGADEDDRYLVVLEDVTERQSAWNEIKRQKSELEEANEGLSRFAYIASHDLQEPLRKIRQFGDLLLHDYKENLGDDGQYYVDVMNLSAARISKLVSDLLSFSSTAEKTFTFEEIDLQNLLVEIENELATSVKEANAKITVGKVPKVMADDTAVRQLFQNLISNAIKYRKPDVSPEIAITARKYRNTTIIKIADNGIGMKLDQERNIFDPFVRLEKRSEFEGSGIGLAICKTVCDRLGWEISVDSTVGSGTAFSIKIPNQEKT